MKSPPAPRDRFAEQLRGFGPLGILAFLVILLTFQPVGAILALLWTSRSRTPWREIGFVRPGSWAATAAGGIVFGVALKFLLKAIVMPLLGAPPINEAYHYLAGNATALPGAVFAMIVYGGFGEETVFRGFLFERLGTLFGRGRVARIGSVLLGAAVFALRHYPDQGLAGVEQAVFTGLVFGTVFMITGRIWMPMFAHAAYDLAAVAMIYWDLESRVAHLVFK